MAFNIFATATSDIPLANLDANFTLIGSAAAVSTLYPTATTSITYGTAGTTHNFSGSGLAVTGTLSATTTSTAIDMLTITNSTQTLSLGLNNATGGSYIFEQSAAALRFGTNNTERARIDSSGNLLVGDTVNATNSTSRLYVLGTSTIVAATLKSVDAAYECGAFWNNATSGNNLFATFCTETSITSRGSITYNRAGGLTVYNTTSDYRLKKHIVDLPNALETVSRLKPRQFDWKETGNTTTGFIAHELAEVCPHAVTGEKDAVEMRQYEISPAVPATFDEEGNELTAAVEAVMGEREVPKYQGIDTSFLVATLTAAIKEQQAIITALTTRITALEAK